MLSGMEQEWEGVFVQRFLSAGGEAFPFNLGLQILRPLLPSAPTCRAVWERILPSLVRWVPWPHWVT